MRGRCAARSILMLVAMLGFACGGEESSAPSAQRATRGAAGAPAIATPDSLSQALVLSLAGFPARAKDAKGLPEPLPARLEFLVRRGGAWELVAVEDPDPNVSVFHKAMEYGTPEGPRILTVAGSKPGEAAHVKLWKNSGGALEDQLLWEKHFGGKFSRMRDVEVADLYGDGSAAMAVATHDQGVVATLRPDGKGGFEVDELDSEPDTFVHEIEIGDLDGDGTLEVYATPSEPNRLDGTPQSGQVVRYVPAKGEGRVVVADLGDRHAKEILVDDVDGDGVDELYVVVEGHVNAQTKALEYGVELRRYDADTDPAQGVVVAEIRDRLARFLTPGDVDGDGRKELVLAGFASGLWLIRPKAEGAWSVEPIDKKSGGFEHAAILSDLDGDGADELYVASDKHNEVRRYVWDGSELQREVIHKRADDRNIFTWNLMPIAVELVPAQDQLAE